MLCPSVGAETAAQCAERVRAAVQANAICERGINLAVTVSLGVAERSDSTETTADLLRRADEALYAAKEAGRNQVRLAGSAQPVGQLQ